VKRPLNRITVVGVCTLIVMLGAAALATHVMLKATPSAVASPVSYDSRSQPASASRNDGALPATASSSSPLATVDQGPITAPQSYAPGIRLEVPSRGPALTVSDAQARCACIGEPAQETELAMFNDDQMTTAGVLVYQNVLAYVYIWKNVRCFYLGPNKSYPVLNTCRTLVFINADTGGYLLQVQD
jgi:hypothetical protein